MSWDSEFAEPIDLPDNVVATTLRQVTAYISELPDAEQNSREWQNARRRILDAADQVGSIWFARIAIIQALQRDRGNVVRRDFRPRFRKRSWSPEELMLLESVRRLQAGLHSFLSMRRIEARRKNASAFRLRFSQSLASLRQRLSQAMVRSTIQRFGKTTNPLT